VVRYQDEYSATIQLTSADKETWIAVYPGAGARYELHIVEKEAMEQEVVADAVVEALATEHGIARDRLAPGGVGPLAPVAPNDSEAGRALNRRVELVKK
jgi:hypothetical protein